MTTGPENRRRAAYLGVFFLAAAAFACGCGRPPDEAWLRFVGFSESDSASSSLSVIEGELQDNTALTAYANFENRSLNVGQTVGIGILVNRAHVEYRMSGFAPPSDDYSLSLYLSPPTESTPTAGSLTAFPLASTSLLHWLINTGVSDPVVDLTARVTFYGVADNGADIETEGSLRVVLTNTGGGVSGGTADTKPTVSVVKLADASKTTADGGFTVSRTGGTTASLKVNFSKDGDADDTFDYFPIGDSIYIPSGSGSAILPVIARSSGTVDRKLIINLVPDGSYNLGTSTASLKIIL